MMDMAIVPIAKGEGKMSFNDLTEHIYGEAGHL